MYFDQWINRIRETLNLSLWNYSIDYLHLHKCSSRQLQRELGWLMMKVTTNQSWGMRTTDQSQAGKVTVDASRVIYSHGKCWSSIGVLKNFLCPNKEKGFKHQFLKDLTCFLMLIVLHCLFMLLNVCLLNLGIGNGNFRRNTYGKSVKLCKIFYCCFLIR